MGKGIRETAESAGGVGDLGGDAALVTRRGGGGWAEVGIGGVGVVVKERERGGKESNES